MKLNINIEFVLPEKTIQLESLDITSETQWSQIKQFVVTNLQDNDHWDWFLVIGSDDIEYDITSESSWRRRLYMLQERHKQSSSIEALIRIYQL